MTPVSHTNYSSKFKIRLSVSLKNLGLRRDKGVVRTEERRRVGKEERRRVEEVKKRKGGDDGRRRGGKEKRRRVGK